MLPSTAKRFQFVETQPVTSTAVLCPQLVPDSGRRHWQCPLEGCILGLAQTCSRFQLVLRGGLSQKLLLSDLKVPAGICAGKAVSLQVCHRPLPYCIKWGNTPFLSSLLQLVFSWQGAKERLGAWQNTQVQL